VIVDLPDTTVSKIARSLVSVREEGGAVALGRVLTLVIVTTHGLQEEAIEAANDASREHPMRVIVLIANVEGDAKLDAQIRVGGDAGASEVIVLRAHGPAAASQEGLITGLLLPDAPVVAWWPTSRPTSPRHPMSDAWPSGASRMPRRSPSRRIACRSSAPRTPPATRTSRGRA
jgi:glucose-6-phosphate dehydrogenase assembly protein OpcA